MFLLCLIYVMLDNFEVCVLQLSSDDGWMYMPKQEMLFNECCKFLRYRIILRELGDNYMVIFQRIEKLLKTIVKLNADSKV